MSADFVVVVREKANDVIHKGCKFNFVENDVGDHSFKNHFDPGLRFRFLSCLAEFRSKLRDPAFAKVIGVHASVLVAAPCGPLSELDGLVSMTDCLSMVEMVSRA